MVSPRGRNGLTVAALLRLPLRWENEEFLEEVVGPSGRNAGGSDYKHRVFMERRECCLLGWVVISRWTAAADV
ncbi:MAG: hypothetical protein ACJAVK_000510 [Akkermansiaceae bacterium]|jgi:hypothetical protein